MKRRDFMISAAGGVAGLALLPRMSFAAEGVIDWYTSSDSNILDFWTNTVKPAFEAANPGITINLVDAGDGAGIIAGVTKGKALPDAVAEQILARAIVREGARARACQDRLLELMHARGGKEVDLDRTIARLDRQAATVLGRPEAGPHLGGRPLKG